MFSGYHTISQTTRSWTSIWRFLEKMWKRNGI